MASITKTSAKKMLGDVSEDKRFFCQDGQVLKNLNELERALKKMSLDTFHHHANEQKNDFSSWIKDVIGDEQLAKELSDNGTQVTASKAVAARVAYLKSKMSAK